LYRVAHRAFGQAIQRVDASLETDLVNGSVEIKLVLYFTNL
jgi:hypothetical protein